VKPSFFKFLLWDSSGQKRLRRKCWEMCWYPPYNPVCYTQYWMCCRLCTHLFLCIWLGNLWNQFSDVYGITCIYKVNVVLLYFDNDIFTSRSVTQTRWQAGSTSSTTTAMITLLWRNALRNGDEKPWFCSNIAPEKMSGKLRKSKKWSNVRRYIGFALWSYSFGA